MKVLNRRGGRATAAGVVAAEASASLRLPSPPRISSERFRANVPRY
jgi:hypothetical protein